MTFKENDNFKQPDARKDGTRFVDAEDLAAAERLILEEQDPARRKNAQTDRPRPQFTLASIMVVTFFVCLGLSAGGDWIPASVFAGVMGFLAIAIIVWATAFPASSGARMVWIGIALAYFVACVVAVSRMLKE